MKPTKTPTQERSPNDSRAVTPGTARLRARTISDLRNEMKAFYERAHLSELLLLYDALLMAESERSFKNAGDDCAIGNAIAECFGVAALGSVNKLDQRRAA